ncbi:MAG: DNA-directed RNA polymerase subunit omega [Candidatus Omnitrophica bacterium]|nr:DNA-directed RNA polymerase subunit omega [Candidatus Omnitrophota bacterium]
MYISRDKLMNEVGSVYKLCNLAAMRAMELNVGMKKLVEANPKEKVTTVAIREIAEGKVKIKPFEGKEK